MIAPYLPYIAGIVTILFGFAFFLGLRELKDINEDIPESEIKP